MAELGLSDFENIPIAQGTLVVTQFLRLLSLPRARDVLWIHLQSLFSLQLRFNFASVIANSFPSQAKGMVVVNTMKDTHSPTLTRTPFTGHVQDNHIYTPLVIRTCLFLCQQGQRVTYTSYFLYCFFFNIDQVSIDANGLSVQAKVLAVIHTENMLCLVM